MIELERSLGMTIREKEKLETTKIYFIIGLIVIPY